MYNIQLIPELFYTSILDYNRIITFWIFENNNTEQLLTFFQNHLCPQRYLKFCLIFFSTEVTNTNGYTPKTNIGSSNKAQMKPSALVFLNIFYYVYYLSNKE